MTPAMKILLLNYFGTLLVLIARQPGPLSHRLYALRAWPAQRNRVSYQ
jgi:hypothetical protein